MWYEKDEWWTDLRSVWICKTWDSYIMYQSVQICYCEMKCNVKVITHNLKYWHTWDIKRKITSRGRNNYYHRQNDEKALLNATFVLIHTNRLIQNVLKENFLICKRNRSFLISVLSVSSWSLIGHWKAM